MKVVYYIYHFTVLGNQKSIK